MFAVLLPHRASHYHTPVPSYCFPRPLRRKEQSVQTQFLNPPTLCPTFGWTHVVTATGGKTVYISGQVSVDERGEVVGKGDLRAQAEQTLENLKHALTAAGATFRDVVKT